MRMTQCLARPFLALAAAMLVSLPLPAAAQTAALLEGNQYLRLKTPQAVETGTKIEVIEFFSYECPHCADFEPILQRWIKTIPADVQFRRVPSLGQDRWVPLAKVDHTLEALGEEARGFPPPCFQRCTRMA